MVLYYILSIISNKRDPLGTTISATKDIYSKLPGRRRLFTNGYGEALIKAASGIYEGEVGDSFLLLMPHPL